MVKLVCNATSKIVIQSVLRGSYQSCSAYQMIHTEFQISKSCFLCNGYPDWFIEKQIKRFLSKLCKNTPSKNKQEKTTATQRKHLHVLNLAEISLLE